MTVEVSDQEVLAGNNISSWTGDHSCDILAKNVAAFCLCPKNLPATEFKVRDGFFGREDFKTAQY